VGNVTVTVSITVLSDHSALNVNPEAPEGVKFTLTNPKRLSESNEIRPPYLPSAKLLDVGLDTGIATYTVTFKTSELEFSKFTPNPDPISFSKFKASLTVQANASHVFK
jgi:hypothetical protein